MITDRTRKESDCIGKLQGNTQLTANSFDASKEFTATQTFGGQNFRAIREQQEKKKRSQSKIPNSLAGIGKLWHQVEHSQKRKVKNRILMVEGNGSGYGSKSVPVLASNNYDLLSGESSVFDRELSHKGKSDRKACAVPSKKKKGQPKFDNIDYCQVRFRSCVLYCGLSVFFNGLIVIKESF